MQCVQCIVRYPDIAHHEPHHQQSINRYTSNSFDTSALDSLRGLTCIYSSVALTVQSAREICLKVRMRNYAISQPRIHLNAFIFLLLWLLMTCSNSHSMGLKKLCSSCPTSQHIGQGTREQPSGCV